MALPPDPDQLANKIASWPKWATEESINNLSSAMGTRNAALLAAVKKTNDLLTKQQSTATKDQNNQKAVIGRLDKSVKAQQTNASAIKSLSVGLNNIAKGQSAVVSAIRKLETKNTSARNRVAVSSGMSPASISLGNRTLTRAMESGFKSLSQQQARANALLSSINRNTSGGIRGNASTGSASQNANRRARSNANQAEDLEKTLGRARRYSFADRIRANKNDEKLDPATRRASESIKNVRQDLRKLTPEQRQAAAKIIAQDIKATFGAAAKKPLEEFRQAVKAAGDDTGKLGKAFKDLDKGIKSKDTQYRLRPGEKYEDIYRRNTGGKNQSAENIKRIIGGDVKGGVMGMLEGMFAGVAGRLMSILGPLAPLVTAFSASLGLATAAAVKLYEVWQQGAQTTIKAFGSGLAGLATTALSFAISAKTAGLTLEQFNKAIADSGNMAGMLDENIRNSGQRFADGAKKYLDSAKKANFYGQNIEQLMASYSRSVMMVGQAGLTGADAQRTAERMAEDQARELYRLAQTTGKSVDELNSAFDQLYRNDMFRAAQQRMLAAGERKAAQELETFGKTLAAIGGQFAGQITNELEYAALGGFDPTVIGGAFAKLQTLSSDLGRIMQSEEYRNETDPAKQAAMLQPAAATALQNLRGSPLAVMAATGDADARGLIDFIRRAAATRTPDQVAQLGNAPTGAGADAAGAYIESQRKLQQVQGDLLRAVEPLMPAFTSLQNAINATVDKFLGLSNTTKDLIYGMVAALALISPFLLLLGGKGIGGALKRGMGGLGGMFGGRGPKPGPTAPPTGPGPTPSPGGAPGTAAAGAAAGAAANRPGTPPTGTPPTGTPGATRPSTILGPDGRPLQVPTSPAPATVPGAVTPPPGTPAPGASPAPNPAAGTASNMSGVASAVKAGARQVRGGGIIGSLFGVVLNEFTSVSDLQNMRRQVIDKYTKGELSRGDAEKALRELDDKIAESRGGSLTRGAVAGAGGAVGGLAGGIAGLGVASAPVGIAGAIGGSMIADKFLGGAAESAGGWISRQFFGASNRGINRELNAIQPTPAPGGAQPGTMTERRNELRVAGKVVEEGKALTPDQMAAIDMALQMDPRNARNYPAWLMEQYNRQKSQGAVSSVTPGAVGAAASTGALNRPPENAAGSRSTASARGTNDITQTSTDEREIYNALLAQYPASFANDIGVQNDAREEARTRAEANRRRAGSTRGSVQTPNGSTGIGSVTAGALGTVATAGDGSQQSSAQTAQAARAEQTQSDIRTLAEQQAQTNQILTAILGRQDQVAGDSRRTVDVLENLNNKT